MSNDHEQPQDSALDRVIASYMEQCRADDEPDRQQLLADHPELAEELKSFLANHDRIKGAAAEDATLPPQPPDEDATVAPGAPLQEPSTVAPTTDSRGGEVVPHTFSSYADAINGTPDLDLPDPKSVPRARAAGPG